jgi:hypothetical protein
VLQHVFWQMQFGLNAFEVFRDRFPEPWERGPSLREKQMTRPASVIIRGTKSANRHTNRRALLRIELAPSNIHTLTIWKPLTRFSGEDDCWRKPY